jgi:hypothetical protein
MLRVKRIRLLPAVVLLAALGLARVAVAAPFVNLDFEQSTVQPGDPTVVPTSAAFPGWTARFGANVSNSVYHNYLGSGEPIVAVFDQSAGNGSVALLQGRFMALVVPGTSNTLTSLSQTGEIPSETRSMWISSPGAAPPVILRINGTVVPTTFLSGLDSIGQVVTYGADLTAFAGQTVEMRFECGHYSFPTDTGARAFDNMRFSTTPIPEPTGVALSLGIGVCVARRRASAKI